MTFRVEITSEEDVILARLAARKAAVRLGFSLVDQTRIITVVSELARNIFLYAGSGWVEGMEVSNLTGGIGLEFVFKDSGPGINDPDSAMAGGYFQRHGVGPGP
ncbi:MAG: ATP-binding protein [Syntrophomonadaceae bacterium]|nr:ATP-binding protein [Syntrophomonadaceae bacterium]